MYSFHRKVWEKVSEVLKVGSYGTSWYLGGCFSAFERLRAKVFEVWRHVSKVSNVVRS